MQDSQVKMAWKLPKIQACWSIFDQACVWTSFYTTVVLCTLIYRVFPKGQ